MLTPLADPGIDAIIKQCSVYLQSVEHSRSDTVWTATSVLLMYALTLHAIMYTDSSSSNAESSKLCL